MTMKHDNSKPMGCSKSSSKVDFYSNTTLPQETRKNRTDNITLPLKQLEKEDEQQQQQNFKLVEGKKS